jgi:mannose-6-phosphate isomerase
MVMGNNHLRPLSVADSGLADLTASHEPDRWAEPFIADPLLFKPVLHDRIWGGRQLETVLGKPLPPEATVGESWEVSVHPQGQSQVAAGRYRGTLLKDLWEQFAVEIGGPRVRAGEPFPFLVKFLDCREPVSVQVHPNDALARRLLGEPNGKSEAWVVIAASPQARIYSGWRTTVTPDQIEQAVCEETIVELLCEVRPRVGDCFHIPAGTVHAMGHGLVLLEVQQSSDATFRMYDWGRIGHDGQPRPLHIGEALEAIDFACPPLAPTSPMRISESDGVFSERLLTSPHFCIDRHQFEQQLELDTGDSMLALALLEGTALVTSGAGSVELNITRGDVLLLPASRDPWRLIPMDSGTCQAVTIFSGMRPLLGMGTPGQISKS